MEKEQTLVHPIVWEAKKLCAGFNEFEGKVFDIDLLIESGEKVAILGKDNSGRGLLLKVLAGLRPVRDGELTVMGTKLVKLPFFVDWDQIMPQGIRRRMGICLEVEGHLSNVSIREGMELLFRFKYGDHNGKLREGAKKIVQATCEKMGLGAAAEKRPNQLTRSERRLAGIARAFLSKPHVVLLENPSQGIGDSNRDSFWNALEYITAQADRTLVMSTDDLAVAAHFAKRWIVLEQGRIVFDGKPSDFLRQDHELVAQFKLLRKIHQNYEKIFEEAA